MALTKGCYKYFYGPSNHVVMYLVYRMLCFMTSIHICESFNCSINSKLAMFIPIVALHNQSRVIYGLMDLQLYFCFFLDLVISFSILSWLFKIKLCLNCSFIHSFNGTIWLDNTNLGTCFILGLIMLLIYLPRLII